MTRRSRAAVVCFVLAVAASQAGLLVGLRSPALRDPEYGRKLSRLRSKIGEHPGRPLVVVLGSSRVGMGIDPAVVESHTSGRGPLVFNYGLIGSGPILELMCLKRLLADGVRPDAVLLEVWPPLMHLTEEDRIDPNRLRDIDLSVMTRYSSEPAALRDQYRWARVSPWYSHREYLLSHFVPSWLPMDRRRNGGWSGLNEWGWLPGPLPPASPAERVGRLAQAAAFYQPILADLDIKPRSRKALNELRSLCRKEGIPLTLFVMPESGEFRSWYSDASRRTAGEFLNRLADEGRLIDTRGWAEIADKDLSDGFHLHRAAAVKYSRLFAERVVPQVKFKP